MALVSYHLVKFTSFILCLIILPASGAIKESPKKPDEARVCARWMWTGDVFERKVYCVEWVIKDCSNRLHVDICKRGN